MKISGNIAEGMLNLLVLKQFVSLNVLKFKKTSVEVLLNRYRPTAYHYATPKVGS